MSLLPDYSRQAVSYDRTRAASPAVVSALRHALRGAPGRRLTDIGGGTGNYAMAMREHGWDVLVVDRSPEMLKRARAKGLATLRADAHRLPFDDASFDACMLVSMLHHVERPADALAEARRILRPGGRLVLMAFAREDIQDLWLLDFFPSSVAWMHDTHPPRERLVAMLPGASLRTFALSGLEDGYMAALAGHPEQLLDARWRNQTSYFERLQRESPAELEAGLRRLRALVHAGTAPRRPGTCSVIAWTRA